MNFIKIIPLVIVFISAGLQSKAGANEDLIAACMAGDKNAVETALGAGADVSHTDAAGNTPICYAFMWPEITQLLVDKGADANGGNYPAIINAANNYSFEVIKILLAAGADPNKIGVAKVDPGAGIRNLLATEKAKGKKANKTTIKTWEAMLEKMQPTEIKANAFDLVIRQTNCVPCLTMMLEKGMKDPNTDGNIIHTLASFSMSQGERKTAFSAGGIKGYGYAIPDWYTNLGPDRNGTSRDMLNVLVDKGGFDVNATNSTGYTPLIIALKGMYATPEGTPNKIDVVKAMIEKGADPAKTVHTKVEEWEADYVPICLAAQEGDVDLINIMLEKGADINSTTASYCITAYSGVWGGTGYTPIIIALMSNQMEIANLLLDKGADFKIGASGMSIMTNKEETVKCIVKSKNKTPMYWAIETGNQEFVEKLGQKMTWKFNPDFSFKKLGDSEVEKLGGGWVLQCVDGGKFTPSQYAKKLGYKEMGKYLVSKGL